MATSQDLLDRFSDLGLTPRLLLQLEGHEIVRRTSPKNQRGRKHFTTYADEDAANLEIVLYKLLEGHSLEQACERFRIEQQPSVVLCSTDPFLAHLFHTCFHKVRVFYWAPYAEFAFRLVSQPRVGLLACELAVPGRSWQQNDETHSVALINAARQSGKACLLIGAKDLPPALFGPEITYLRKPVTRAGLLACMRRFEPALREVRKAVRL